MHATSHRYHPFILNIFDRRTYTLMFRLTTHRYVVPILIGHFCHATCSFVGFSWLPTYYHETSPNKEQSKAMLIAGPYACMAVCSVIGAQIADRMLIRGKSRTSVRRLMGGVGYAMAAFFMMCFVFSPSHWQSFKALSLTLSFGLSAVTAAGHEANKLDVTPPELAGVLQGISNTFAAFGGVIGVPAAAYIFEITNSWVSVFACVGLLYVVGSVTAFCFAIATRIPLADLVK
eukprot:m.17237 g.17237  ORF g.17237 m.17237 type:complete len:232 (-) comp8122_c0_seq1:1291-1986(-)